MQLLRGCALYTHRGYLFTDHLFSPSWIRVPVVRYVRTEVRMASLIVSGVLAQLSATAQSNLTVYMYSTCSSAFKTAG